jgi:hemerythrin
VNALDLCLIFSLSKKNIKQFFLVFRMKNFVWCEALSVGIDELDTQHKHFLELVNTAHLIKKNKKNSKKVAEELMIEIEAYARKHFDTEEKYFEEYNYPKAAEHALEHVKLLERISAMYDGVLFESISIDKVADLLDDWLEHHLLTSDMDYAKFINTKRECGDGVFSWFCRVLKRIQWFFS